MTVGARTTGPETAPPAGSAAAQASTPIDLSLAPAATQQSTSINIAPPPAVATQSGPTVLTLQSASAEVKRVARWVSDSRDNGGLPFLLVDKANAQVFAFSPVGQLQGSAPVLLGMAKGDRLLAPNTAAMSQMPPQVRITPAGRFVSRLAIDSQGKELLVLDYDASISLHPVIKGTPEEHRAERLASVTSADNRISYGCINVPPTFYTTFVHAAFNQTKGIVYVLPETSTASQLFGFRAFDMPAARPNSTALNAGTAQSVTAPDAN